MNPQKRAKINKILIIAAIVLVVIAIIATVIFIIWKNEKEEENYEDTVVAKRYFAQITVDLQNKKVERDEEETTLRDEFDITEEQENLILSSEEELRNFFIDSTFDVQMQDGIAYITDDYQTKKLIIEASELKGKFKEDYIENVEELQDGIYILTFDTQKRTRDAYEYFSNLDWVTNVEKDKVSIIPTINDVSQTVYGEDEVETDNADYKVYGVKAMGLDNFQNIINENGNPSDITVATIGYGACIDNEYFMGRISENYYNFIEESQNVYETIPQGSRILEVISESTTHNVKMMPLVVVDAENYTTTAAIIRAIVYATQNSDVICYELTNEESYMIELALKNAFKENVPVCAVTTLSIESSKDSSIDTVAEDEGVYPANNSTTIAVASIDKSSKTTSYSGSGDYLDFAAFSTDVEEIFNTSSSVSRWSGPQYSNAEIASAIALIKTYHKDYTILEVYNELRNYCVDLGEEGKDEEFGYGCPNFSELQISDLDKISPEIQEVIYNNDNWEKSKNVQIKASDNIRIWGWAITKTDQVPSEWNQMETLTSSIDVTGVIEENGIYYVWVTDSAGNTANRTIEINKIDTTPPKIQYAIDNSTQETEKYITINITATDEQSGLNETPYSFDGENWGVDNNQLKVTENGRYKVYVRDSLENIAEQEIVVDTFPQEGVANIEDGEIIKSIVVSSSWAGNTNKEVRITFNNNINIVGWAITENNRIPDYFNSVTQNNVSDSSNRNNNNQNENNINATNTTTANTTNTANATTNVTSGNTTNNSNSNSSTANDEYEDDYDFVTITLSLDANKRYYAWVRDSNGNIISQAFSVSKVEI